MIDNLEEIMSLSPRDRILSTIASNPGLHFREIQRRVGIATGALQYHLDYLKKKNMVREQKEGKFSRFYLIDADANAQEVNPMLMNLLRQDSVRKIIIFLLKRRKATLKAISLEVGLGMSTTSFHLSKLTSAGVVKEAHTQGKVYFSIINKDPIIHVLVSYKESFLDSLVDNFVELWEKDLK